MRFILHLLGMITVALAVGFGLSYFAVTDGRFFGAYRVGPWEAWPAVGSNRPDPYTRAYLVRSGALQLGLSEGLRFTALTDSDGRQLDRACRYRIDGRTPVASIWTLVPTARDGVNIARPDGPPAARSNSISRAQDGSLVVYVSRTLAPENWLEVVGEGPFQLVLTLYDTSVLGGVGSSVATLPAIIREGCA